MPRPRFRPQACHSGRRHRNAPGRTDIPCIARCSRDIVAADCSGECRTGRTGVNWNAPRADRRPRDRLRRLAGVGARARVGHACSRRAGREDPARRRDLPGEPLLRRGAGRVLSRPHRPLRRQRRSGDARRRQHGAEHAEPRHHLARSAAQRRDTQTTIINGGRMDGWSNIPQCIANGVNRCVSHYEPSQIPSLTALADKYVDLGPDVLAREQPVVRRPHRDRRGHAGQLRGPRSRSPVPGLRAGAGYGCNANKVAQWIDPTTHVMSMQPSCIPAPPGVLDPVKYPYNGPFEPSSPVQMRADDLRPAREPQAVVAALRIDSRLVDLPDVRQVRVHLARTGTSWRRRRSSTTRTPVVCPRTRWCCRADREGPASTHRRRCSSVTTGSARSSTRCRPSPQWSSTAIFITYDDCGCFYDHVPPPGLNPDGTQQRPPHADGDRQPVREACGDRFQRGDVRLDPALHREGVRAQRVRHQRREGVRLLEGVQLRRASRARRECGRTRSPCRSRRSGASRRCPRSRTIRLSAGGRTRRASCRSRMPPCSW